MPLVTRDKGAQKTYALSIKQPWAALLVHGRKSVEIRGWSTQFRGLLLIHAARFPDPRKEAWKLVPRDLLEAAHALGGIIGQGELMDCISYPDPDSFRADQDRHLNQPEWFKGPTMYGFAFANVRGIPFLPYPGQIGFFPILQKPPARSRKGQQSAPDFWSQPENYCS